MFRSRQYRAKAAEYGELVKSSGGSNESRTFQDLQERLASRADNEQALADSYNDAVQVAEQDRSHGAALAAEEEHVLRCLGAAIIMQWNSLPTTLQREIFDTAGSVGKLLETAALLLMQSRVDDGPHNMDGLRFYAQDGSQTVEAFISRKVLDVWADSVEHRGGRQSLFRDQYNALGKLNFTAIQRIVSAKYHRGAAFNRQHPFVEILFSDITESGETLDLSELVREPLPPAFHKQLP
jgi:hypothetical protein